MPIADYITSTIERLAQAAAYLGQAILLIEEVAPGVFDKLDPGFTAPLSRCPVAHGQPAPPSGNGPSRLPITDRATFHANLGNRSCYLGNTVAFKLLERLARRPNQFVHCETLLEDLWDCHTSREAVRSAVKILRRKLNAAGMKDLAGAIDSSTSHHYGLMLDR